MAAIVVVFMAAFTNVVLNAFAPLPSPPSPPGKGVGCVAPHCLGETDFTDAQIGTEIALGIRCGRGFGDIQNTPNGLRITDHNHGNAPCDEIIAAANADGQSSGRGFRHYRSVSHMGQGIKFIFPARGDVSVSFLMRYSLGFKYSGTNPGFTKETYGPGYVIFGHQGGAWGLHVGGSKNYPGSVSWSDMFGNDGSDGKFHCYEYRVNIPDKRAEVWVDGVRTLNVSNVDYKRLTVYDNFHISNQSAISVGGHTDYDRFRMATGLPAGAQMGCQ